MVACTPNYLNSYHSYHSLQHIFLRICLVSVGILLVRQLLGGMLLVRDRVEVYEPSASAPVMTVPPASSSLSVEELYGYNRQSNVDYRITRTVDKKNTTTKVEEEKVDDRSDPDNSDDNGDINNFDKVIWPELRGKLCPNGLPYVSMGETLFGLARKEFGINTETTTASKNNNNEIINKNNNSNFTNYFYDGEYGLTVFIDGDDPSNNVFYAPIWKCANNQIHSYLMYRVWRLKKNQQRHSITTLTPIGNANDMYSNDLRISDLDHLFHEQIERNMASSNNATKNSGTNKFRNDGYGNSNSIKDRKNQSTVDNNDVDVDDGDYYFTFNHTRREKPCVFTVIRDPVSHFLSGYNEAEYRLIEGIGGAPPSSEYHNLAPYYKMPYLYNASDRDSSVSDNDISDYLLQLREDRFTQFVRDVLEEHPSFVKFPFYKHFASMSRILPILNRYNLLPTSTNWFLPTLDKLTETFPLFLADRCPSVLANYNKKMNDNYNDKKNQIYRANKGHRQDQDQKQQNMPLPLMSMKGSHDSSKDKYGTYAAAKNVWKKGGTLARALCLIHAFDYACFYGNNNGDMKGSSYGIEMKIPKVCRDTYASDSFREEILRSSSSSV